MSYVFRCFRALERFGDRVTGAAGPVFVTLAIGLISTGIICFFDVVQPTLPWPWLTTPIFALVALNLAAHYYYVLTVSPGFVEDGPREPGPGILWARRKATHSAAVGVRWSEQGLKVTKASETKCKRCGKMRPERAHHCRVCNRCVLKYDHHWINQCVGLHNERHFVMFLAYLVIASFCYCALGWPALLESLGYGIVSAEPAYHVPPLAYMLTYILAGVMCLAVAAMFGWHMWSVAAGETSVEGQDHEQYRRMARGRGEDFVNSYDLGVRKNLELFFNLGRDGYPWYTLVLPLRIMPYTDGRAWARREGLIRHGGVREGEELTDEEEEEDAL